MRELLQSLGKIGYVFQPEQRIWARTESAIFDYSDGDNTENLIHRIISESADVSVFSRELRSACTDWPTTYHLSSTRANLLRPLTHLLDGDILEVGAGCGAITRFLGEAGGKVVAVEGSARRAMIAAQRVRDLPNVVVVNDQFENFAAQQQFDVVTLIGVLEYAGKFNASVNPVRSMLESIRKLLKPGGTLIIAIENQLGLKYLAGAPEDHLGVPRVGIQGLYPQPGVETFGHRELYRRLSEAGFSTVETALPFPDYKLPASIILPAGHAEVSTFDASTLAAQVSSRDPQLSSHYVNFSLECTWREVGKNRLLADLSNSFLIAASTATDENRTIFSPNFLAYHYSTDRQPALCKLVEFEKGQNGDVKVNQRMLQPSAELALYAGKFSHRLPSEGYFTGEALSTELLRVLQTPGWTVKSLAERLSEYLRIVLSHVEPSASNSIIDLSKTVPGYAVDLIPQNILVGDGRFVAIDLEWIFEGEIPLGYLLFRSLITLLRMISSLAVPRELRWLQQGRLFEEIYAHLGADFCQDSYEAFAEREAEFMSFVSAILNAPIPYEDWHKHLLPTYLDTSKRETESLSNHIRQVEELAETYISQIRWLEGENGSLHAQIYQLEAAVAKQKLDIGFMEQQHLHTAAELRRQFEQEVREVRQQLERVDSELGLIKSSRTWRLRSRILK